MKLLFLNSLSEDGNMCESIEQGVGKQNSEKFFAKNNVDISKTVCLNVADKNIIKEYDENLVNMKPYNIANITADALITKEKGIFIYQKFADCIPFTVFDKKQNILVFSHLGLQSVIQNLHIDIINELVSSYNCQLDNLKCYLGPSIKKESYLKKIEDKIILKQWGNFLEKKDNDLYSIDMQGYVVHCLTEMDINKENIEVSEIDTYEDKRYFSHYRSKNDLNIPEQRFIYGVMMVD